MKIGDIVKISALSPWGHEMVNDHGSIGKVGKIGKENIMIVNIGCTDVDAAFGTPDYDTFHWGYWINEQEATLEVV